MVWTDRLPLDHVLYNSLPADTLLWRSFRLDRSPVAFWPIEDMRFAAFPRSVLYTGNTETAAISETLLRDPRPFPGTRKIALPFDNFQQRGMAKLRLRRDVPLISLCRPAIAAFISDAAHHADVRALIDTTAGYGETERFARALLAQAPDLGVLAWPSRRADGHTVYCFYADPLGADDFEVLEQTPFISPDGYEKLVAAVNGAGLELIRDARVDEGRDADP